MENGLPTGSGYLRLVIPYSDLKSEKFDIYLDFEMALPKILDFQNSCCVYLQRDGISNNLDDFERWAQIWKYAGNKIFYDIDDNLFDRDELAIRVGSYDHAVLIANKAEIICKYADLITVSTTELYKILKGYSDNVIVIPNTISKLHWDVEGPIVKNSSSSILTIGYVGTPTHDKDLELVHQSVRKIMEDYAGKVVFEVIGAYQNIIPPIGKKIWLPDKSEYPIFVEWLQKVQNWDIGIIPLVDDSFNQSKSNLKFLEYAAMGIPIICSDVPSYRNIAKNMDNCIVVNNTELSWYNALKLLIDDFYLRKKIADNARASLLDNYITEDLADNFLELLAAGTLDD
jgi:glycosyltransferase involved in cell wall biosynthesis